MNLLFVYGSLRPGACNFDVVAPYVKKSCPAYISGKLYQLSTGYPMLVYGEFGKVAGELLLLDQAEAAFKVLDDFEDFYGAGNPLNEYERICANVWISVTNHINEAFVYACPPAKKDLCEQTGMLISAWHY